MPLKKRKISGLSSVELAIAYRSLLSLKQTIIYEAEDVGPDKAQTGALSQEEKGDIFDEHLSEMIHLMKSMLEGPQSFTFSSMTQSILRNEMHILSTGFIKLKDSAERIQLTKGLGQDEFWSSDAMYRHLTTLEMLVPRTTEASARAWIDTFFFRASAMVPVDQRMVLNMEYIVPSTMIRPQSFITISGRADYTAIIAPIDAAAALLKSTQIENIERYQPSSFFVVEGKLGELANHVPQAVSEIYGCAKMLNKSIVRGALTNGREWIFIIVYLREDGDGGTFRESFPLSFDVLHGSTNQFPTIVKSEPDLIAGILSYWIQHSFEDITADDWFQEYTGSPISGGSEDKAAR